MKNYVQAGNVITAIAPTGGVVSGDVLIVGSLFGICATDALEGAEVEVAIVGVFELPKKSADAVTLGAKLYWDDSAGEITVTNTGNVLIGAAAAAAGAGTTVVRVRLNGVSI